LQTVADGTSNAGGLAAGTTSYLWDGNGNMLSATNTVNTIGNKSFTYNLVNLPATATFNNGSGVFTYDAAGSKLRKASTVSGTTTYTDYIAGIQHSGTTSEPVEYIMTEEGQAAPNGTTSYDYQYFLGDNLGNTRESFGTKTGIAVQYQRDDYYPFGMEANNYVSSPKNYYLYNKKEQQPEFNENDYGARFYDPVIARWTSVDPLAEVSRRWSTYNYVENDPIRMTDPDGMEVSYDGANAIYTGDDAVNFAWGLKIAGETTQQGKDKDKKDAKKSAQQKNDGYVHNKDGSIARYPDGVLKERPEFRYSIEQQLNHIAIISDIVSVVAMVKGLSEIISKSPQAVDKEEDTESGGAARAKKFSSGWGDASLGDAIAKFAPDAEAVQSGQKILYKNQQTGVQVVYDEAGNYFRVQDTKLTGRRQYLDLNGNIPNNKVINGKSIGRSQSEYNQATHFNNSEKP
jgi:RHS repeat-associated protein